MIAPLAALLRIHEMFVETGQAKGREANRLRQSLPDELWDQYSRVRVRHGVTAVAEVDRGVCKGCHMRQPGQQHKVEEDIYECESCGRLIYDPEVAYELSVG